MNYIRFIYICDHERITSQNTYHFEKKIIKFFIEICINCSLYISIKKLALIEELECDPQLSLLKFLYLY